VSGRKIENSRAHNKTTERCAEAIAALRDGDVIVFPTETLYGLGADALNCRAVEQVFQLKGRDPLNPIPVLVADQRMLYHLVTDLPTLAQKLIDQYWPGPLTLVLPGRKDIPTSLLNATGGVGVRLSSEPIATQLVRALGRPLTATSANPSGQEPARTLQEANKYFADRIQIFVDGGTLTSKRGSTVVEVMADRIKIIREGEIRAVELRRFFGSGKILTT
jgi:L-threonylcarbamoyladenylate synthase